MADTGPRGPQGPAGTSIDLPVAIANGGTGATTAAGAVESLGILDAVKVGGRNLYTGTADFSGDWVNITGWHDTGEADSNGNAIRERSAAWSGLSKEVEAKAGEVYTLSASIRGDGASTYCFFVSERDASGAEMASAAMGEAVVAPTVETRASSGPYVVKNNCLLRFRVENSIGDATLYVSSLKLERGNVATDWTPAPEDIEARLAALEAAIAAL